MISLGRVQRHQLEPPRTRWQRCRAFAAVVAGAALVAGAVAGCGPAIPEETAAYPTEVDIGRAQLAWSDPWVAGTDTSVAGGPNLDLVENQVALRRYSAPRQARDLLLGEVGDAQEVGWKLVATSCPRSGPASALLSRGKGPEDGLLAQVTVTNNDSTTASGKTATNSDVLVNVYAAFHAQTQWPTLPAAKFAEGCPADDDGTFQAPQLPTLTGLIGQVEGFGGPTPDGPQEWPNSKPQDSFANAVTATAEYPLIVRAGVPPLQGASLDWASPKLTLPKGASAVQYADFSDVVQRLVTDGWQLNFASCSGRTKRTIAELSSNLAENHRTVIQLQWSEQRPSNDPKVGPATWQGSLDVAVVASPAPASAATPCWDKDGKPRTATFISSGSPSFGPLEIWPIQGLGP